MEYEKAVQASELVQKLIKAEKRLSDFDSTKEFCKIIFKGENGNEINHEFTYDKDELETRSIREHVRSILSMRVSQLTEKYNRQVGIK